MAKSAQENLRRLYESGAKHFTMPDFNTFQKDMQDEEKRRRFYNNMQGSYTLPDFETFSRDVGIVDVVRQPVTAQKSNSSVQGVQSSSSNVGNVQSLGVKATGESSSKLKSSSSWQPSLAGADFERRMGEMRANYKKRIDGIKKGGRFDAGLGTREFNPDSGKTETVYYTGEGERVGTRLEQSRRNTAYNQWWENNTEEGKRSKEARLQREYDARISNLWEKHDPSDSGSLNAAERAWEQAEGAYYAAAERNRKRADFNERSFAMSSADAVAFKQLEKMDNYAARLSTHDINGLMEKAWSNLGEKGQKALVNECYEILRYRYPGGDEVELYRSAEQLARWQSDMRMYNLAVEKNVPRNKLDFFMRKVDDGNLIMSLGKGFARARVGKVGDVSAYEQAMGTYASDNKLLDVAGVVTGFAFDPTTWLSAGVGGLAGKATLRGAGRVVAGKGATAARVNAAVRKIGTTLGGRIAAGVAGGAANFGTFKAMKEAESQFVHGGYVNPKTGENEGYSGGAVLSELGHGLMMGAAIGWISPVSGNVSDKLVRATSSTAGKVAIRSGAVVGSTLAEGTIFSVPEWISGERGAWDVWTDNMAMMAGFKVQHGIKSAPKVIAEFGRTADGRRGMESRIREYLDKPSDGGMSLTRDEKAELNKYGYNLNDMVRDAGDPTEGAVVLARQEVLPSRLTEMVTDARLSESVRAKMYYYATGRRLPMSTIMHGELLENEGGNGFTVQSIGANGVITSRSFKNRKAADMELERINRQAELNWVDVGERYRQDAAIDEQIMEASRRVAAKNNWNAVDVYKVYEKIVNNRHSKDGAKDLEDAERAIYGKILSELGEIDYSNLTGITDAIRNSINEKYGVDIDKALSKEFNRRTKEEQEAIDEYKRELFKDNRTFEDGQKLLTTDELQESIEPGFVGDDNNDVDDGVDKTGVDVGVGDRVWFDDGTYLDVVGFRGDGSVEVRYSDVEYEEGKVTVVPEETFSVFVSGGIVSGFDHFANEQPLGRAVMKFEDRPVEVMSGRVVMMEDGSMVDKSQSDATVVIRDLSTGKIEMCSPEDILSYEGYAEADKPEGAEAEPKAGGAEPTQKYGAGVITIRNSDGSTTMGYLTGHIDENGEYEYVTEGNQLHHASESVLDSIVEDYRPEAAEENAVEPTEEARIEPTEENAVEPAEENTVEPAEENAVEPAEGEVVEETSTPLQRVPKDDSGQPIFEAADHETAWDALVEYSEGDASTAKEIADAMVEEKKKALDKAQKLRLKGKTPAEMLESKKANAAALSKAQQEFEQWQRIANVEQRRKDAELSARAAEVRQRAEERAAQEAAERAAREEAERIERESLEGVPEWHQDTPENARARGFRRYNGQKWERQGALQGVGGKEVEVKFSSTDLPKGRVAVIEASELQPSHIQGERNPLFFIEEAQPKNRTDDVSRMAARAMAENIRPEEITGSATAYTGAPTVNTRGEVIQGNNRSDALRYLWDNPLKTQQGTYKQYLIDHAEQFGIDPAAVEQMQQPVLVNMLDVDDAEAIRLGQLTAQDTESGGIERIKAKNVAQKLGDKMRQFANMLLRSEDDEVSFGMLVDRNGVDVLKWMNEIGAITPTQYQSAFDSKGNLTAEAKNDLSKVLYQAVFKGANQQLEELFEKLPAKAQRAILSTAFRDLDSPFSQRMLGELQASVRAYDELRSYPSFASAKNMEEVWRAVEAWRKQTALDDSFNRVVPADNYSNFALRLAAMYKAIDYSQKTIATTFNDMYDLIQGVVKPDLFNQAPDATPKSLADAIKETLEIEYQPAKNDIGNGRNGSTDVVLDSQASEGGQQGSSELPASGEPIAGGEEPTERGAGASDDSRRGTRRGTVQSGNEGQSDIQPSETEVSAPLSDTETDEFGKPLVLAKDGTTIFGLIDADSGLTEAPIRLSLGENRVDGEGKNHGYGLLHIEAGHGEQIRNAGYSKIEDFVEDVAKNYTDIREGAIIADNQTYLLEVSDEHNNTLFIQLSRDGSYWNVNSAGIFKKKYSRRKPKVYPVPAVGGGTVTDTPEVNSGHSNGATAPAGNSLKTSGGKGSDFARDKQGNEQKSSAPKEVEKGEGYAIEPKPYTNKQGKTLDTYLVTFDRDFSREEISALRAKAKEKLAEAEELMRKELADIEAKYAELDAEVDEAQGVSFSEEDEGEEVSEPEADYGLDERKKIGNFASRYETQDGKTINYTSENPEAYGVSEAGAEYGRGDSGARRRGVQRKNSALLATRLDQLGEGEYSHIERIFRESNYFEFTGGEKVTSAADVAFIFDQLENADVENAFVVLVKRGRPTVVHLSMGTFTATMVNVPVVKEAAARINPDKVYFVHNHPSGQLKCSPQDMQSIRNMEKALGMSVDGVIINLKSGKYGTFGTSEGSEIHDKGAEPEKQRRLRLYAFDRHVFAPDYDPTTPVEAPMNAEDVAKYISSHRLGSRGKISYLIRAHNGGITANIHSPYTEISYDNMHEIADDIISHITNFGGTSAFIYGDYDYALGDSNIYGVLRNVVRERSGESYQIVDAVRVGGNATWSAQDRGLMEPGTEYGTKDGDLRYREVEDEAVLDEFASGKTVKAYRTMQVIDGGLYSPMATKVGGKETPEIRLGVAEQSEEHPEIIKGSNVGKDGVEYGVVVINKGLGKGTLEVAYNPYIHASRTALNDQFTSAHVRPNLVTVEVEIPESELASGYRAESAKNAVGEMPWHSGSVSGQLADLGNPRRVILSRYDMPVRIVPFKEVAQMIAKQLAGTDIEIPYNVVQPQLAEELRKVGVRISDEASGSVGEEEDFGRAEYITDEQIAAINERQTQMADASVEGKRRQAESISERLNTPVRIVENVEDITDADTERQAKMRRAKGWYDKRSGEIVINLSRNRNIGDVAETMLHEVVAHKGLRELVGEDGYSDFLRDVYEHCKADVKKKIAEKAARNGWDFEKATDEYLGELSEKGFEDFTEGERSIWQKLKDKVLNAINKLLKGIRLPKWVKLGDNELRYMLWRSHENLRSKGNDYVSEARNAAKREEIGLSDELMFRNPGETDDIWTDGSLGLEERITNASLRLSNNQRGDLRLRVDAMRAVCDNLQTLLHDMRNRSGRATSFNGADEKVERGIERTARAQRVYDRVTAKRVGDLARVLIQSGYLHDMTSGEMQRIVSALKNATGAEDIANSVEKIMDIMIDNQLRGGSNALSDLLSISGSKVDARGVEVQGRLDADGARMMQYVRRGMKLSEKDIRDKIDEAQNRMGDSDQTIADDAALEYAGLQIALEYVQNITASKNEEKDLRDSMREAKAEKDAGRITADAYDQFIEATEDAIRKNKIERAEAYNVLVGRLSEGMRQSIENAKEWREAEKRRIQEIQHNANSDMQGMPSEMHRGKETWKDGAANLVAATAFAPLATFEQMIRGIAGQKAADGDGYLPNRFVRGLNDARSKEISGYRSKQKQLDDKAKEMFSGSKWNVKSWGDVIRLERKLPKMTVRYFDKSANEYRESELMQGNLLYIYMVDKMSDGRMKLRKMGITEGNVEAISQFLDPRIKALGDWLQDEFLVETRNEYNETHKRIFGASMAAIDNYFPLKILGDARGIKEDIDSQDTIDGATSTTTGAIKKRKVDTLAIDILGADAFCVVLDHIAEMEHWNAYAELGRDMNALLSYGKFRNRVKNMRTIYGAGEQLWKRFKDVSRIAFGTYHQEVSDFNEGFLKLARGVTAAKVAFRLNTALKQTLSLPALIPDMSLSGLKEGLKNPRNPFSWCMENLPVFEERWRSRISGDPRLMKSERGWNDWRNNIVELAGRWGMTPNAFIDAMICSVVAKTIYDTKLAQYIKDGYAQVEAEAKAKQDASIGYNLSQQSNEGAYLAPIQAKKDWLSVLFTVFRNSPMSYTRQVVDSLRNMKRNLAPGKHSEEIAFMAKQTLREWGKDPDGATANEKAKAEEAAKRRYSRALRRDALRLLTYGFVLPGLWSLGGYWLYMLLGNDDEEKQQIKDDVVARLTTAPFEGLTGGDVLSNVASGFINGTWNENTMTKDMPLSQDIAQIAKKLFKDDRTADGINDIFNLCVQSGFGFNPATIENAVLGILDACGNDVELANEATIVASRILNCPESQVKKLYFDEIGMSGEEASKLSPAEIAERYARMQVKLGRPLFPWLWDDEAAIDKRMSGSYGTITTAKERFERQGDPEVKEAYAVYAERYAAIDERVKAAKRLAHTDYVKAAKAMSEVQSDADFLLYQQFGTLDKVLTKLSGMWIKSKSGVEAKLISTAIESYRSAMVNVLSAQSIEEQQTAMQELQGVMEQFSKDYSPYIPKIETQQIK